MIFQRENIGAFFNEVRPLALEHLEEIKHGGQIPYIKADVGAYEALEDANLYRSYTARDEGMLVGYAGFYVAKNIHCVDIITANSDLIYVMPDYRGIGLQFLAWCDEQLKLENVATVYHHVSTTLDFSAALNRLGYSPVETIHFRKL